MWEILAYSGKEAASRSGAAEADRGDPAHLLLGFREVHARDTQQTPKIRRAGRTG
jgi:hypothetical protein